MSGAGIDEEEKYQKLSMGYFWHFCPFCVCFFCLICSKFFFSSFGRRFLFFFEGQAKTSHNRQHTIPFKLKPGGR